MNRLFALGLMVFIFFGCTEKKKKDTEVAEKADTLTVAQEDIATAAVKFPVYDFKELEPLLHKKDDKTYIINFWATWCKPCIKEMPYFERVHAEQKDNNVKVILVNLDIPSMWKSRLEPYVENKGIQSEVVILDDPKQNDWIPKVSEEWGGGIPATLIYNKDKRTFYERGFTYEELNEELNTFIN
ncbi:TlpA disulfide reductase family protein [Flagellimonas halotolerans]|uniref:TlpA disulfide reductase family protein n=1 Tax=Flagellimonas halotolerans TaxID=3112164 RepID=A0ABU6IS19_9FLAO|nr:MULTISPECIES: TlpA disulfide reductase family protein [unclassified Allomuricauda]MEC3965990.1 TlpA disulfide reductase family protein [Muricauda sp. SYSU M86414]MEC4265898.1 TlpA disulfide reductase family protein [Muricauda sp. SYSU M84420]